MSALARVACSPFESAPTSYGKKKLSVRIILIESLSHQSTHRGARNEASLASRKLRKTEPDGLLIRCRCHLKRYGLLVEGVLIVDASTQVLLPRRGKKKRNHTGSVCWTGQQMYLSDPVLIWSPASVDGHTPEGPCVYVSRSN